MVQDTLEDRLEDLEEATIVTDTMEGLGVQEEAWEVAKVSKTMNGARRWGLFSPS